MPIYHGIVVEKSSSLACARRLHVGRPCRRSYPNRAIDIARCHQSQISTFSVVRPQVPGSISSEDRFGVQRGVAWHLERKARWEV
jgi:hypothetical protein